jgi:hypothetical protein
MLSWARARAAVRWSISSWPRVESFKPTSSCSFVRGWISCSVRSAASTGAACDGRAQPFELQRALPGGVEDQAHVVSTMTARLGFDRAASVRSYDVDGRLRVESANISAATVNGYLGREVPRADELGLEPDRVYQLLRDPDELRKAAETFCGLTVLSRHEPLSARDHDAGVVVGCVGTDVEFVDPYLRASLVIWDQRAIDQIGCLLLGC